MTDSLLSHIVEHGAIFLAGGTALGIISHAVQTFPQPKNPYAVWLLGSIQYAVGQRLAAKATLQGTLSDKPPQTSDKP